jgi:arsenate reductase (thioredoxin)
MSKSTVLFLCVGNTCRSQMAEAIVNARLSEHWQAFSAGSRPGEKVNPFALRALSEIGIDHHGRPKSVEEYRSLSFDVVITVCGQDDEQCPVWLGKEKQIHQPYPDPAVVTGSEDEKMTAYRSVRDRMIRDLPALLI